MLSAAAFLRTIVGEPSTEVGGFQSTNLFYGLRLVCALALATLVPFLIDRHARRSTRVAR
jgi:hypothetical protein